MNIHYLGQIQNLGQNNIVYFEPKNIQHKKLINGITDQFKVSLIDGDGNEISSNFKISIVLHVI